MYMWNKFLKLLNYILWIVYFEEFDVFVYVYVGVFYIVDISWLIV